MTRRWRRYVKVAMQTAPIKEILRPITLSTSLRVRAFSRSATTAASLGLVRVGTGSPCKHRLRHAITLDSTSFHRGYALLLRLACRFEPRSIALDSTSLQRGYALTGRAETLPSLA